MNDVYKLFNHIQFDESELDTQDVDIGTLKKEQVKRNLHQRIKVKSSLKVIKYSSAAAVIGLVCLIGLGTIHPAFAENIPILNYITQSISDRLGHHIDYMKYTQLVGKSVTNNGVTITINDVLADDVKIMIGYTIKGDKKIENIGAYSLSRFLNINGKSFASAGSAKGYLIDDYTYIQSEDIHIALPQGSDKFNVGLNITEIGGVNGKWDFAFSVSKSELAKSSTVFTPNTKFEYANGTINVKKVIFSPLDTSVFINGQFKNFDTASFMGPSDFDDFLLFDDQGEELLSNGGGGSTTDFKNNTFSAELSFYNLKNNPKYLTIIPYRFHRTGTNTIIDNDPDLTVKMKNIEALIKESIKESQIDNKNDKMDLKLLEKSSKPIAGAFPIELKQGNLGKLIINEINATNNGTIVKFTAEGRAPAFQQLWLYLSDTEGGRVPVKSGEIREDLERPNEYKWIFEAVDPGKKYRIGTDLSDGVELREDLKFNIELKK